MARGGGPAKKVFLQNKAKLVPMGPDDPTSLRSPRNRLIREEMLAFSTVLASGVAVGIPMLGEDLCAKQGRSGLACFSCCVWD